MAKLRQSTKALNRQEKFASARVRHRAAGLHHVNEPMAASGARSQLSYYGGPEHWRINALCAATGRSPPDALYIGPEPTE
jgi:hypothetical protein